MHTYSGVINKLGPRDIFVFGSNLYGLHGAGSAGYASFGVAGNRWREFGYAQKPDGWRGLWNVKGQGEGLQHGTVGWSYALPTVARAGAKRSRTPEQIIAAIRRLYDCANRNEQRGWMFFVAQTSRNGLNGYSGVEMASFFREAGPIPNNVAFECGFAALI